MSRLFGLPRHVSDRRGLALRGTTAQYSANCANDSGGMVTRLIDKSSNRFDLTRTASSSIVLERPNAMLPVAIRFQGGAAANLSASISNTLALFSANETAIIVLYQQNGAQLYNGLFQCLFGADLVRTFGTWSDTFYFDFANSGGGRTFVAQPSGWDDRPHSLVTQRRSSGAQEIWVDGKMLHSATATGSLTASAGTLVLGNVDATSVFSGYMWEFIICKNALSAGEIAGVAQYAREMYGVS